MEIPDFSVPREYELSVTVKVERCVDDEDSIADAIDWVNKDLFVSSIVPDEYEVKVTHINGVSLEDWNEFLFDEYDISVGQLALFDFEDQSFTYFKGVFNEKAEYSKCGSYAEAIEAALHYLWTQQNDR